MRKGFLAAAALALGSSTAHAQYWPAYQAPVPMQPGLMQAQMQAVPMPGAMPGSMPMPGPMQAPMQAPMPVYYGNYRPVPQPVYYPQAYPQAPAPMMQPGMMQPGMMQPGMMQPNMAHPGMMHPMMRPNMAPMPMMPVARPMPPRYMGPGYLPQNYFPVTIIRENPTYAAGPSSPVPPVTSVPESYVEPLPGRTLPGSMPGTLGYGRGIGKGPGGYFNVVNGGLDQEPIEVVEYHRPCHDSIWTSGDLLFAWARRGPLETPLVTTSTNNNPDVARSALGEAGTIVLYGGEGLPFGIATGVRGEIGMWLDESNHYSIDLSGFWMYPRHIGFSRSSDGDVILGRPFFNVAEGQFEEDVYSVADNVDGVRTIAGIIDVDSRTQVYGAEFNGRWHKYCGHRLHTECLMGLRTVRLIEKVRISDTLFPREVGVVSYKGIPLDVGEVLVEEDRFRCENTFFGFQVGGRLRYELDWFYLDAFAKVGMGVTYQVINIQGNASLISSGKVLDITEGGILALPSNSGESDRTRFGVIPEIGVSMGMEVCDNLRFRVGYSVLMWNNPARPGDQIDRQINAGQVPGDQEFGAVAGLPYPRRLLGESVYWLQTINLGLEFHY